MYISNYRRRSEAVFLIFLFILILCILRVLYIQFFRSSYLKQVADKQHNLFTELEPRRGSIYDSNLRPQAFNMSMDSLYANPSIISDDDNPRIVAALYGVLGLDRAYLTERLNRKKAFIWLARKLPPEKSEAVRKLKIKGLGFLKESKRIYPNGYLASHIIGFAGMDNNGLAGVERDFDKYLRGEPGWALF